MRHAPLLLITAGLLTLAPAAARADDPPRIAIRLRYVVGPAIKSCPPEQTLHDEVARRMGYDPFTPDAPDRIVATLKRAARGLTARVERFDSKDVPQWEPQTYNYTDCGELVRAMGIYISEMFRPHIVLSLPETPPPSPPAGSSSTAPPVPPTVERTPPKVEPLPPRFKPRPPPSPPPSQRWAGRLAANVGPGFGVAPADVTAVMSLEGGAHWRLTPDWVLSGSLGVLYSPHASAPRPEERSRVEVGTTLVTSMLAPCVHRHLVLGWVFGCVGLELGGLRGDGSGIRHPSSGVSLWAAVNPRLGIEVPVASLPFPHFPQLALRLFGDLPVPLYRPKVLVGEGPSMSSGRITEVWRTPAVAGSVSLGLVLWFDPTLARTVPRNRPRLGRLGWKNGRSF